LVSQNITVPATMTLKLERGCILTDDGSNATLTINGHLDAGLYQIFDWGTGTGAISYADAIFPQWFASGVGTVGDPWTGWDTTITWASGGKYVFEAGYYSYATAPNWAKAGIDLEGRGDVYLVHTGSGSGIDLTADPAIFGVRMKNFKLIGNDNTDIGLEIDAVHHSNIEDVLILKMAAAGIGMLNSFTVLNNYKNIQVSTNVPDSGTMPTTGLKMTLGLGAGRPTANTFDNFIAEGVSGTGIDIDDSNNNYFYGGASEGYDIGISIDNESFNNTFIQFYGEINTTSDINIIDGHRNVFINPYCNGSSFKVDDGDNNSVYGGTISSVLIGASAKNTYLSNVAWGNITNSSTTTTIIAPVNVTTGVRQETILPYQPRTMTLLIDDASEAAHVKCSTASVWRGKTNAAQDDIGPDDVDTGVWNMTSAGGGSVLYLLSTGITGSLVAILSAEIITNNSATAVNVAVSIATHMIFTFTNAASGAAVDLTTLVDTGTITLTITYIAEL